MEIMKYWKFLLAAFMLMLFAGCAPQSQRIGNQEWTLTNTTTYTWEQAMNSCPQGFHLPHLVEMEAMENARRSESGMRPAWCFGENGDIFESGLCYTTAQSAFWTSVEADKNTAYTWDVELDYAYFKPQAEGKHERRSVICVKD